MQFTLNMEKLSAKDTMNQRRESLKFGDIFCGIIMAESEVKLHPMPEEIYKVVFVRGRKCFKCGNVRKLSEFDKNIIMNDKEKNLCKYCLRLSK